MNLKNLSTVVLILSALFLASCNLAGTSEETLDMPDVKVENSKMGNEVVFDDAATENNGGQTATFNKAAKKSSRTVPDGKIDVIQDKIGNTIEVRYFNSHPNLAQIMITTRPDGTKEIIAIGHNRENKRIPPEMSDQALTLTGPQIAELAGIHTIKQTRSNRSMTGKSPQAPPPAPTYQNPAYQYPVQTQPTAPVQTQNPPAEQDKLNQQISPNQAPTEINNQ